MNTKQSNPKTITVAVPIPGWKPKVEVVDPVGATGADYINGVDFSPVREAAVELAEHLNAQIDHPELLKALYWVYDFMDRALIEFFVVGKTADAVKNTKDLYGDKLTVAVRKSAWESGSRRIADNFATPLTETPEVVTYEYEGVPITLYVLEDNDTISSLDQKIYHSEFFKLPNPYDLFVKKYQWLN